MFIGHFSSRFIDLSNLSPKDTWGVWSNSDAPQDQFQTGLQVVQSHGIQNWFQDDCGVFWWFLHGVLCDENHGNTRLNERALYWSNIRCQSGFNQCFCFLCTSWGLNVRCFFKRFFVTNKTSGVSEQTRWLHQPPKKGMQLASGLIHVALNLSTRWISVGNPCVKSWGPEGLQNPAAPIKPGRLMSMVCFSSCILCNDGWNRGIPGTDLPILRSTNGYPLVNIQKTMEHHHF